MMLQGGEGYFWPGRNGQGVLLLHGFTGSPAELRELGERLRDQGYTVYGLRLAGHGTDPRELCSTVCETWLKQVREAAAKLRTCCGKIYTVGLSMGGMLALYAAAQGWVDRAAVLSTPVYLFDWRIHFLWLAERLPVWAIPKRRRNVDAPRRYDVAYHCMPIAGIKQLARLFPMERRWIAQVTIPLLVIQSRTDHTVRPESAQFIYDHAPASCKKLIWVPKSRHVMTLYKGREKIYQDIEKFLEDT